jgi:putative endopeptidase
MCIRLARLLAFNMAVSLYAAVAASPVLAETPMYPPAGLDMSARDSGVQPGDDFFQYANGAWLARTVIPSDKPYMTDAQATRNRIEAQLHGLMETAAASAGAASDTGEPRTLEQKVGAFYKSFMDAGRVNQLREKPIAVELGAIRASTTRTQLAALMGHSTADFDGTFIQISIDVDLKDPAHYAVYLNQGGITMPDRDYYLKENFSHERQAFGEYVERLLTLDRWPSAQSRAVEIVQLETRIARASWAKEQQRDLSKLYNPFTPAELQSFAPGLPWGALLQGAGLEAETRVIVGERTAFPEIAKIFAETPLETLKAWLAFTVTDAAAPYLSDDFVEARFKFRDQTLQGVNESPVRWKRGIAAVSGGDCGAAPGDCFGTLNWAVGELYTAKYFPPHTKKVIQALVDELIKAFRGRIERLAWMDDKTRAEALHKLDTYVVKVGYPDNRRDYSGVLIRDDDLVGNVRRAAAADWAFYRTRSAGPVDKSDWGMTPQTFDAYNGALRDVVFPAAILQAPDFDPNADPAVNYGAIGATIGHELTHGFDDQGRTIDTSGALRDWWSKADADHFKARAAILGAQYAEYEPAPGLHIRPDLTMGENIADLGGLLIALDAYHASLQGGTPPVIEGMTGDQRFFLSYAQSWRGKAREDYIRQLTTSNPHSWRKYRVNGVVRNIDAWYEAFAVRPTDKLYLDPTARARIW